MPLIPALRTQRQEDLCEFEVSLVCRVSSRTARAIAQRNPVSKKQKKQTKKLTEKKKLTEELKSLNRGQTGSTHLYPGSGRHGLKSWFMGLLFLPGFFFRATNQLPSHDTETYYYF